jgi:hypothetical protein
MSEGLSVEQCIEHVCHNHVIQLSREPPRVLQPGGFLRLTTPDLDEYVNVCSKKSDPLFSELHLHPRSFRATESRLCDSGGCAAFALGLDGDLLNLMVPRGQAGP